MLINRAVGINSSRARWYEPWKTIKAPLQHTNGKICHLESTDKLSNISNRIQDTIYCAVFFADDPGMKSCHLFLLF